MSGQRNIKPTDASKFRQAYMANLALEANINDKNLQANKIFLKTGVAPNQPVDNRTTSEKLADVQRLKIDVRSSLSEICDGENADTVVNSLDEPELVFIAQHIQEIIKEIKPKYKYGVPADILVDFLNAYMERAQETNEVNFGLQQAAGQNLLLGVQQILGQMVGQQDLLNLADLVGRNANFMNRQLVEAIKRDIQTLYILLPKVEDLRDMENNIDANTRYRLQHELNDALGDVAVKGQIRDLSRQLQQAVTQSDQQRANEIASVIHQILQLDPASQQQLQRFKAEVRGQLDDIALDVANGNLASSVEGRTIREKLETIENGLYGLTEQTQDEIKEALKTMGVASVAVLNRVSSQLSKELKDMSAQQADDIVQAVLIKLSMKVDRGNLSKGDVAEATAEAFGELGGGGGAMIIPAKPLPQKEISEAQKIALRNAVRPSIDFVNTGAKNERDVLFRYCRDVQSLIPERYKPKTAAQLGLPKGKTLTNANFNELLQVAIRLNEVADELLNHSGKFVSGYGLHKPRITGRGLSRQIREDVLTKTDFTRGIMPQEKYIPFGKHYIDQHRINDDIVNIKRHNGVNIVGIPVRRVSKHLGEVMRTIIGQGIPSYNQIDKLTKEEKNYLHKIAKSSDLLDRLHIPSPTKEEDDQDINEFEVLKGELLCGNDGSETVKKFKLIIMRMMNKGLLPKGQARELLLELATLGH
jgi:hypothetical protein